MLQSCCDGCLQSYMCVLLDFKIRHFEHLSCGCITQILVSRKKVWVVNFFNDPWFFRPENEKDYYHPYAWIIVEFCIKILLC